MQKMVDEIKEIIQDVSGLDSEDIDSDCNLFTLGLDSLMLVQIKKGIDKRYQIELPIGRMMSDMDTIHKIVDYMIGEGIIVERCEEKENEIANVVCQEEEESNLDRKPDWKYKEAFVSEEDQVPAVTITVENELDKEEFTNYETDKIEPALKDSHKLTEIMEMQLRVMSNSLQELAVKQLEMVVKHNGYVQSEVSSAKLEGSHDSNPMNQPEKRVSIGKNKELPQINFRAVKLEHDRFTSEQKKFIEAFIIRYNQKTRKSKDYAAQHREHFCDWITTLNFRMDFKELIYPIVTDHSSGARFWDLDGNCYLDMAIGYGVHYFGHRPQFIVDALQERIAKGYETGPQTSLGGEVSRLICKITGCERAAFANTGSEAVMAALRIARTVTKRPKVVMFKGAYHGNFDCVLAESDGETTFPISPGTMPGMVEDVMVLEYGTDESLQIIAAKAAEIAAVIVEPVQSRNPSLQPKAFLTELRKITENAGTALIFDEMITGFRICPGGCQEYFGIQADMATYGKIIGGGMPIGVVAGKAKYLDAVDGGMWNYVDESYPNKEMTYFAGTFCKHPLSLAASRAVLQFIEKDKGEVQRRVNALTEYFVKEINSCFAKHKVPLKVTYFGSEFRFEPYGKYDFQNMQIEMDLFFYLLMEKGIYIWEKRTCFFSAAHTLEDAQFFLNAVKESILEIREGGFAFTFKESANSQKKNKIDKITHKASQAQERFFLVSQFDAMEKGAHLPSAFLVKGDLQSERLKPIFQEIVDRHEALRTSYEIIDGEVVQCISEKSQVEIVREDGEGKSLEEIFSEFIVPFDLHHAPLFRVKLILLGEKTNILLTDIHHSIADGYSCTLIMKEFMERYLGRKEFGKPATYLDYLNFQEEYRNSLEYTEDVKYWKSQLLDANDKVTFPSECKKSDKTPKAGGSVLEVIDVNTTKELKQFAKEMKCSLYQLLYSAYSLLLSKMSGALDFTIGIPVDMRGEGRFDETIGMLTNTMVIRNHLNPDWNFETYLCENRKQFAKAFQHRRIPYEEMVSLLGTHSSSLFEVMFVFENAEERVNQIDNLICENLDIPLTDSYYDISMEIIESGGELKVQVYYKQEHYQVEDARQILSYYKELITSIMDCRDKKVMDYLSCYEEKWKPLQCQTVIAERNVQKKEETVISEGSITSQEYIEKELIAYWQECLKIEHIDRNQNFFDMGGKSLDGIRLVNEWKKKYEISITDLFRYSTIASLSDVLANRSQQLNSLEGKAVNVNESLGTKKDNRGDHPTVPVEVANHQQMPIAIIGMAGCFPQSDDVEEFWKNLSEGKECITFFEEEELLQEGFTKSELEQEDYVKAKGVLEHADCFDAAFFGYTPKEVEMMDPQIRLFHQCAWNALEDAGYGPLSANAGGDRPFNAGVFAGSASNYTWMSQIYQPTDDVNRRVERISLNDKDYMSTRISYKLNLNGPSYGVQTACSTSLAAIHLACRSLELGECNIALAGGVCLMLPKKTGYRYQEGMILSKDGHCKVFGEDATGTVFSDGVGAVVLKPLADAMRDGDCIYAVIKGTAVNNDGNRKAGYTAPSIEGQAEVILKAYQHAGIEASTVTYVETHGTGTVLGDPIEIEGLKTVYPKEEKSYCALGSLKSNYGHLDAAGGVAGVIKAALALKNRKIPKTLYTDKTNPQIALEDSPFYFPQETIAWMQKTGEDGTPIPRRAGISAFGFGGTNAHIVLEEAPCSTAEEPERCKDNEREQKLIVLSAKRKQELIALKEKMIHFLSENPAVSLEAMESVLQLGRKGYAYREAYVVSSVEELTKKLSKDNGLLKPCSQTKTQIVFLFTGQGSQYVNMARELYQSDKVFHELMEDAFMILHEEIDYRSILYPDKESIGNEGDCSGLINQTENAQIILFILEYAMASYLIKLGVKPDVLIGHSLGEYVAATVAGVFTLEEGLTLVRQRAKLMQSMQPGAMDMVLLPEQDLLSELKIAEVSLAVAAVNGPEQCVVSGTFEQMELFEKYLSDKEIIWRRLQTSHAFHSPLMEGMLDEFGRTLSQISMKPPKISIVSNLTGDWVGERIATIDYWKEHLRSTVRFHDGLSAILKKKSICIEVGPGKTLGTLVRKHEAKDQAILNCNTIPHPKEQVHAQAYFTKIMGCLWCHGIEIDFGAWQGDRFVPKISLPGYPFAKQRFPLSVKGSALKEESRQQKEHAYRPCWKSRKLSGQVEEKNNYLVIGTNDTIMDMVVQRLKASGHQVENVLWGENWKEQFIHILTDTMVECKTISILYLVPYVSPSEETCFYSLMELVKELGDSKPVGLFIVTGVPDTKNHLMDQLVTGICAGINREYWNLSAKQIQLGNAASEEALAQNIVRECEHTLSSSCVRYENGLRLEPEYEEIVLEQSDSNNLRKGGNYLITGASGGIGTYLAEYLEKTYDAHVLRIARHEDSSHHVQAADVTQYASMEDAIHGFESQYGPIQGVFHLAGMQGEGLLKEKTREQAKNILSPKMNGIMVLDQIFQNRKLDFMFLFSSLSVITGDAGQSDYIAANAYMDAYASWAFVKYPNRRTVSVNWDNWTDAGMAHRALEENASLKNNLSIGIKLNQGMRLMEQILTGNESQVILSATSLGERLHSLEERKQFFTRNMQSFDSKYARPELEVPYKEPVTEIEKELVSVWEDAFSIDGIGIDDDFFLLGGDSLYAVGMANTLKKKYQIDITDIYRCPTIRQLAKKLVHAEETLSEQLCKVKNVLDDWEETNRGETELQESWKAYHKACEPYQAMELAKRKHFHTILLLGASGYIGIYLLREMLLKTEAELILIVRRKEELGGNQRIMEKLTSYFGTEFYQQYQKRIHVLEGEVTRTQFGLSREQYLELANSVECIVNASGKVDHYGEWDAFYEANVGVVGHCIQLAKKGLRKEIHQLSTKGVGTGYEEGKKHGIFTEFTTSFYESGGNFYVESKQQAEQMLMEARKDGINTIIYRVGDVVYDTANGHFQENIEKNALYLLMQSILRLDVLPKKLPAFLEFSYVDFVSQAIVAIMETKALENEVFHMMNPYPLTIEELEEPFEELGYRKKYRTIDEFFSYLAEVYDKDNKKEAVQNFLTYTHLLELPMYTDLTMTTSKTEIVLEKLGLTWVKPDVGSVKMMIGYGEKIHFF